MTKGLHTSFCSLFFNELETPWHKNMCCCTQVFCLSLLVESARAHRCSEACRVVGTETRPVASSPLAIMAPESASPCSLPLQILLTFDDQFLLTVSDDGCLFTWKVFDKEGRGIKREREVGFAEEVLVTKTDMEEKVRAGDNEEEHRIPQQTAFRGFGI